MSQKPILLDFSRSELEREVVDVLGQSRFRARQIWQALHRECISDFELGDDVAEGAAGRAVGALYRRSTLKGDASVVQRRLHGQSVVSAERW